MPSVIELFKKLFIMKLKKRLFVLLLSITCSIVKTQTLSGVYKNSGSSTGSYYTDVKWQVSYSFEEDNGSVYLKFYNPKISVPNYSKYNFYGDIYSLGDIGLSSWPQSNQLPYAMQVKVNVTDGNKNYDIFGSCDADGTCERTFIASKTNIKNYRIGNMNVPSGASSFHANLGGEPKTEDLLKNLVNKQSQNRTSSSREVEQSSSSETISDVATSSYQYTPTPSYTKKEITNQVVAGAAGLVGELLNDWNANREKRWAREAEMSRKSEQDHMEYLNQKYLVPLQNNAENGNHHARMILYFTNTLRKKEWLYEAYESGHLDAMLEVANEKIDKDRELSLSILENAANLGSVDAMVKLANWYDNKTRKAYSYDYVGGENPTKAFEWFEKAASLGSPVAMYRLGMIYKYSSTRDGSGSYSEAKRVHVEYNIPVDEMKSLEWFAKSIVPDYEESLFSTEKQNPINLNDWIQTFIKAKASYFHPDAFLQLANFYKEGKVVPKDKIKVQQLKLAFESYRNVNKF